MDFHRQKFRVLHIRFLIFFLSGISVKSLLLRIKFFMKFCTMFPNNNKATSTISKFTRKYFQKIARLLRKYKSRGFFTRPFLAAKCSSYTHKILLFLSLSIYIYVVYICKYIFIFIYIYISL